MSENIIKTRYKRLSTVEVKVGDLLIGNYHPISIQTMTTTDTMDTTATVAQTIRCIQAGAQLVRITAPSKKEAENLLHIRNELHKQGYTTPLVADIHFTPNAAEIAARIVEKVRINPGNYIDKKKFELIEYSDADYEQEIERIQQRFTPLVKICKEYGTAMRIGTNHGSLSDRIMSRYGDTPLGMVESAMEFLRIARYENYHNIVLSMKSSNPRVMVQAYRLLADVMQQEFGICYPLHLGVTEAGDGEDGRIKSAIGIASLLEDGIGDTIRVSLTEDPEFEVPVCADLVKKYNNYPPQTEKTGDLSFEEKAAFNPLSYRRRTTFTVGNMGGTNTPVVIADLNSCDNITPATFESVGYLYDTFTDKWTIKDIAADYIYTGNNIVPFALPGNVKIIVQANTWLHAPHREQHYPIFEWQEFTGWWQQGQPIADINFVMVSADGDVNADALNIQEYFKLPEFPAKKIVFCVCSCSANALQRNRSLVNRFIQAGIQNPVVVISDSSGQTPDEHLIHFSTETGALFLDGLADGICLGYTGAAAMNDLKITGRTYLPVNDIFQFTNNTAFSILQATRTRISKTEYISCPSCGRTLFDLQETTALIRSKTHHLKGVKIAIMGCIVNGPGEMADADFGYVGSGPGKITLYKGKEVVKRNVNSEVALEELITLLRDNGVWIEAPLESNSTI